MMSKMSRESYHRMNRKRGRRVESDRPRGPGLTGMIETVSERRASGAPADGVRREALPAPRPQRPRPDAWRRCRGSRPPTCRSASTKVARSRPRCSPRSRSALDPASAGATCPRSGASSELIDATVAAMADGVELILGGWLPDDEHGRPHRTAGPAAAGRRDGYVPGDVKWHKTARPCQVRDPALLARRRRPETSCRSTASPPSPPAGVDDYLQLAHYWRMLEACGVRDRVGARGFIIGTDAPDRPRPVGLHPDLARPRRAGSSRRSRAAQGKAKRTALERYDFEHAIRSTSPASPRAAPGAPMTPSRWCKPIFSQECDSCPWHDYCHELAGDAASAHIKIGRLDCASGALSDAARGPHARRARRPRLR